MVGGTNQASDLSKMRTAPPDILVATPGRLNDNLSNAAVSQALGGIRTLVFDEADRLLDMGFRWAAHAGFPRSSCSFYCHRQQRGCCAFSPCGAASAVIMLRTTLFSSNVFVCCVFGYEGLLEWGYCSANATQSKGEIGRVTNRISLQTFPSLVTKCSSPGTKPTKT